MIIYFYTLSVTGTVCLDIMKILYILNIYAVYIILSPLFLCNAIFVGYFMNPLPQFIMLQKYNLILQ